MVSLATVEAYYATFSNWFLMRVLQIMPRLPFPPTDGHAIGMTTTLKGALENGLEVHVLAFSTPKHPARTPNFPEWFQRVRRFYIPRVHTGVNPANVFMGLMPGRSLNVERFNKWKVHWRIEHILRSSQFDFVFLDGLYVAPYLSTIRKRSDAVVVMRAHNVEFQIWRRMADVAKNPLKKSVLRLLARKLKVYEVYAARRVDALVAISDVDRETFRRLKVHTPIYVMPAGIDIDQYRPAYCSGPLDTVFIIGSMDWFPNVQGVKWFLRSVWPLIHRQVPHVRCVLAGKNMPEGFMEPLPEGVISVGEVADAHEFMRRHGVMAVPLLAGSGTRIKIIEGMALGKAIVATSIGAEGLAVRHGENILIGDTPEAFARSVVELIEDPVRAEALGRSARATAEQEYGLARVYRGFLDFMRRQFPYLPFDSSAVS